MYHAVYIDKKKFGKFKKVEAVGADRLQNQGNCHCTCVLIRDRKRAIKK
jgi:hypothetical protein